MHNLCYHVFKTHSQVTSGQKHARPRTQNAVTRHVTVLLNYTVSTDSAHVLQLIICVCIPLCNYLQHTDHSIFYLYYTRKTFWFTYMFFRRHMLRHCLYGEQQKKTINQLICMFTFCPCRLFLATGMPKLDQLGLPPEQTTLYWQHVQMCKVLRK